MIYFISDTHLGARYIADKRRHEKLVTEWLEQIADDATELYLLGDMLDFWFEYRAVAPRGFVRFLGALARLADRGVKITWIRGNHDMWIFDYLPSEIGLEIVDGPIVRTIGSKRFLLDHGDGVGKRPASFRLLRAVFRNNVCRRLYAAIHPRWTTAIAHGWSAQSRKAGRAAPHSSSIPDPKEEPLVQFSEEYNASRPEDEQVDYFVYGHRHAKLDYPIANGSRVIILGDWINHFTYACFDGNNLSLNKYNKTI